MAQENLQLPAEIITSHHVQTWPDLPGFVVLEVHTGISHNPAGDARPAEHGFRQILIRTHDAMELGAALRLYAGAQLGDFPS